MHNLSGPDDARNFVDFWAAQGVTSYKAYMNITRAELKAAVDEAHKHNLKVTGHLCAVTYPEAAEIGIDNLEHGFFVNTQNDPGKQPNLCPRSSGNPTLAAMDPDGADATALIKLLIDHHVAITSTLPVFESDVPTHVHLQNRVLEAMSPPTREAYLYTRNLELTRKPNPERALAYEHGAKLEHKFVAAGGLLMGGPDPTGDGGTLPGFGDQREVELLVDSDGFTPVEAIKICTLNGATYLGAGPDCQRSRQERRPRRHQRQPRRQHQRHRKVEMFKDGVGYDSETLRLHQSRYGQYRFAQTANQFIKGAFPNRSRSRRCSCRCGAVVVAVAFFVVIPEGDLLLPALLFQSSSSKSLPSEVEGNLPLALLPRLLAFAPAN
jgi:hypothetical protein